ncbi:response regulator transcription factor [Patescibacteria group bacterium]|nr:response regulator transcription factor [Patescibacteria group bacterium]MBU1964055.1 response regulator transcription factor [Patescibacteria group bacterium]
MKNNSTILVLDTDKGFTNLLQDVLHIKGLRTTVINSAGEGVKKLKKESFIAIIVDPFLDENMITGTALVELIRNTQDTPILALSGVSSVTEKVRILDAGADDYLTKPCALAEMIARINSLLRQGDKMMFKGTKFEVGDIEFDVKTFNLLKDEKNIKLTEDEYNVLYYLWINSGKVISAKTLCNHALSYKDKCSEDFVKKVISTLRVKLRNNVPELIHTVKSVGYTMNNKKIAAPEEKVPKTPMVGSKTR